MSGKTPSSKKKVYDSDDLEDVGEGFSADDQSDIQFDDEADFDRQLNNLDESDEDDIANMDIDDNFNDGSGSEDDDVIPSKGKNSYPNKKTKTSDYSSEEEDDDDHGLQTADRPYSRPNLNHIKNKEQNTFQQKRNQSQAAQQTQQISKREKKKRREKRKREAAELGELAPPKLEPRTRDSMREPDETYVLPADDEVAADEATDVFADHFEGKIEPKVLITTNLKAHKTAFKFIIQLAKMIPNSQFFGRKSYPLKTIIQFAKNRNYTHIIIVNEDNKKLNGMLICYLPKGPTATFKLSSVVYPEQIPGHASMSKHLPELILNNFNTRLGHTIGRLFGSLFPVVPEFHGRRVITVHNQRDFLFFRQHRYIFDSPTEARLQEMGPSFTLKLRSLQHGTFDTKFGEYEFIYKPENRQYAKKKFVL